MSPSTIDRSTFCRGGGATCECEQFCWQSEGSQCDECHHGVSKHPVVPPKKNVLTLAPTPSHPIPSFFSDPPPPPGSQAIRPVPNSSKPSSLLDFFPGVELQDRKAQWGDRRLLTRPGIDAGKARAEAVAMFGSQKPGVRKVLMFQHFPCHGTSSRLLIYPKASTTLAVRGATNRTRHPSGTSSRQVTGSSMVFQVSSIGMIVCGIGVSSLHYATLLLLNGV